MLKSHKDKENSVIVKSPKSLNILKPKPLCFKRKPRQLYSSSQPLSQIDANVQTSSKAGFLLKSPATYINPFRCLEKRKREHENFTEDSFLHRRTKKEFCDSDSSLQADDVSYSFSPVVPAVVNENAHSPFDNPHFLVASQKKQAEELQKDKNVPVDWSLKTKIRLTSPKPFPWRTNFTTSEEASGTTGFVRCLHPDSPKQCTLDSSHGAKFYQQCLVWGHPTIPWLDVFPWSVKTTAPSSSSPPVLTSFQQDVLHSKWCDSFRSLYQLVRMRQCPFFYFCAPTFTILFRAGGVDSLVEIHAAITPTTRGFRKALKEEGIEFTMPLCHDVDKNSSDVMSDELSQTPEENSAPDRSGDSDEGHLPDADKSFGDDDDDDATVWLESLGLSQQDFPLLDPKRIELKNQNQRNVDHRPESLVFVEGRETQVLVNFLLNYPGCVSRIGLLAGVPPTLLSPVAFLGATLHTHKVRHGKVRNKESELYAVELNGPLLPNTIHSLCSLFNSTQDGSFSATLMTHQPTVAFTRLSPQHSSVPSVFATENLKDCGLSKSFIHHMCSKNPSFGENGINIIKAEDGFFTWS